MKKQLSVVIITKNESENIEACLKSVQWADEIIIIDSGSTDETEEICRKYTDNFYIKDWPGFGLQKQRVLDLASCDWVLSIDADERVSAELKHEILNLINSSTNEVNGYLVPRLSEYLGKKIYHAGWYPDYVLRLAKNGRCHFTKDLVHERMVVDGVVGKIKIPLTHYPYRSVSHHFQKLNEYSSLSAEKMFLQGREVTWVGLIFKSMFAFFRAYMLRRGILDGWSGLVVSISTSVSVYMKYLKLMELQKNS